MDSWSTENLCQLAKGASWVVWLVHVYIVLLETFLWSRAVRIFKVPPEQHGDKLLRKLMFNTGIYNGFLVAGLTWTLLFASPPLASSLGVFFCSCVVVAAMVGAVLVGPRIFVVQGVPAIIALVGWWSCLDASSKAVVEREPAVLDASTADIKASPNEPAPKVAELWAAVEGVFAPDTLALRSQPGTDKAKVADIPANESKVVVLGPHKLLGRSTWVRVRHGGQEGWVNRRFLSLPGQRRGLPSALRCAGTEPFWSLLVDAGGLATMEWMDKDAQVLRVSEPDVAVNRTDVWSLQLQAGGNKETMSVVVHRSNRCSDGMSDRDYAFEIYVQEREGPMLAGCCDSI